VGFQSAGGRANRSPRLGRKKKKKGKKHDAGGGGKKVGGNQNKRWKKSEMGAVRWQAGDGSPGAHGGGVLNGEEISQKLETDKGAEWGWTRRNEVEEKGNVAPEGRSKMRQKASSQKTKPKTQKKTQPNEKETGNWRAEKKLSKTQLGNVDLKRRDLGTKREMKRRVNSQF